MAKSTINSEDFWVAAAGQVSCDLQGETAILALSQGMYYGLDSTGTLLWNLLQKPCRASDLEAALLENYEIDPATCRQDARRFIEELAAKKLIEKAA